MSVLLTRDAYHVQIMFALISSAADTASVPTIERRKLTLQQRARNEQFGTPDKARKKPILTPHEPEAQTFLEFVPLLCLDTTLA